MNINHNPAAIKTHIAAHCKKKMDNKPRQRKPRYGHKSIESAFNGVILYISAQHPGLCPKTTIGSKYIAEVHKLIVVFLNDAGLPVHGKRNEAAHRTNANTVQNNWPAFKKWLKNHQGNED